MSARTSGFIGAAGSAHVRRVDLLDHVLVGIGVPERRRQDERVRRSADGEVGAVELGSRGAESEHERRVVADELVAADALEDERRARVEAAGHALVGRVAVEALRGEADAEVLLRRHAAEAPQPARLAGQAVVMLARRALPVLGAVAPPHLDVAAGGIHRRHPIEAVAAHVHQPAALVEISAQRR